MSYTGKQVVTLDKRCEIVNSNESFFMQSRTNESMKWEKESQFAIQILGGNDFLAGVAVKNPESLQNAIINVAAIDISLNPALKHAYLVPRNVNKKQQVCLDISYMGLIHIAVDSGSIKMAQAKLVHANDTYQNMGMSVEPKHDYNTFGDRGAVVGVYCCALTLDGVFITEEMSIAECYKIRDRSEAFKKGFGPWKSDEGEMLRKTVIKRGQKYWPKSDRMAEAIQHLDNNVGEGIAFNNQSTEIDITPPVENPLERLKELLIDKPPEKYLAWLKTDSLENLNEETMQAAIIKLENGKQ